MKVLFIEDDQFITNFFLNILEKNNYETTSISNQDDFINYIDNNEIHTFDVILCDHNFPSFKEETRTRENGLEVFFELFHENYKGTFIHFSYDPCEHKYELKNNINSKIKFKTIKKRMNQESSNELLNFLKTLKEG